jgi:glycosyltransferase involved in cell wall biosynthesis
MKVHFFQPPPEQRTGGLDAAITSLRDALTRIGVPVEDSLPERGGIAHFHGLWQPAHARLARESQRRGAAYVVSPHGMLEPWAWRHKWWKKWPYFHLLEKKHLQRAAVVLATCNAEAQRLREMLPGTRVEAIALGLTSGSQPDYEAARSALGWGSDERILLFLSRLHAKKGLDLLLRALAELPVPAQTRLVVVGGGDERYVAEVRALAKQLETRLPRIDWRGEIWGEARWPYFQGADLFCLPSHSENFGLAVLEACQVGTPALTTRATPWGDWLSGERGYVGEATTESVRELLARFFQHPPHTAEQRAQLAAWAHAEFSWDALAPRYAAIYRSAQAAH